MRLLRVFSLKGTSPCYVGAPQIGARTVGLAATLAVACSCGGPPKEGSSLNAVNAAMVTYTAPLVPVRAKEPSKASLEYLPDFPFGNGGVEIEAMSANGEHLGGLAGTAPTESGYIPRVPFHWSSGQKLKELSMEFRDLTLGVTFVSRDGGIIAGLESRGASATEAFVYKAGKGAVRLPLAFSKICWVNDDATEVVGSAILGERILPIRLVNGKASTVGVISAKNAIGEVLFSSGDGMRAVTEVDVLVNVDRSGATQRPLGSSGAIEWFVVDKGKSPPLRIKDHFDGGFDIQGMTRNGRYLFGLETNESSTKSFVFDVETLRVENLPGDVDSWVACSDDGKTLFGSRSVASKSKRDSWKDDLRAMVWQAGNGVRDFRDVLVEHGLGRALHDVIITEVAACSADGLVVACRVLQNGKARACVVRLPQEWSTGAASSGSPE